MSMFRNDFSEKPPLTVLLQGAPKTGKTDMGCRCFPEPVFLVDTELRGGFVADKYRTAGRDVRWAPVRTVKDLRAAVVEASREVKHLGRGSIVIDSATDLQPWLEDAMKDRIWEEEKRKKPGAARPETIFPLVRYREIFGAINQIVQMCRDAGAHLLLSCREKPEYVNDQETGRMVLDGCKRFPYNADLWFRAVDVVRDKVTERKHVVLGNAFSRAAPSVVGELDWGAIMGMTVQPVVAAEGGAV